MQDPQTQLGSEEHNLVLSVSILSYGKFKAQKKVTEIQF